jgi:hypothetical protein
VYRFSAQCSGVYTQVLDASLLTSADRIGGELSRLFTSRNGVGAKSLI